MADRPIIFSAPMVRALLDRWKSQTRRMVGLYPSAEGRRFRVYPPEEIIELEPGEFGQGICHYASTGGLSGPYRLPCAVGDRLWVREAWAPDPMDGAPLWKESGWGSQPFYPEDQGKIRWRSPIHMPRRFSRLTLTVTEVRVQRLQEISEEDARAEGCDDEWAECCGHPDWKGYGEPECCGNPIKMSDPRGQYCALWNSIHGPDAWAANPWVAAISFTVHRINIDAIEAEHGKN